MIGVFALLAAGLVPPSNGVRFIEPDPFEEIRRAVPAPTFDRDEAPQRRCRPPGWVVAMRVTPAMRRWADRVLVKNRRIGAFVVRRFPKVGEVLARVEWHRHGDGPRHRGVSLYVRGK